MISIVGPIVALNKVRLEANLKMLEVLSGSAEKLIEVQLNAGRVVLAEYLKATKQLAATKDLSELSGLAAGAAQPRDKATDYAKSVYEIYSGTQSELVAVFEQSMTEFNRAVVAGLDAALKTAPAGSEGIMSAVRAAVHSANSAYETMVKGAKQIASTAEANLAAVAAQNVPAKRKAA